MSKDKQTLINVHNISRYYGDHCAIDDISFSVARGEVLGFLGPNGAGKSTTMQIICGVLAASEGKVTIADYDIVDDARLAKQHLGFLPERPPLYEDLCVNEYLRYCARIRQLPKNKLENALANSKERCGLQDHGGRLIANLSKGYQQRVGIAQSIIHSPAVVILDEPTSGLDPAQIIEIRELISELGADHSVILSTHILSEVQSNCDRVLIVNRGKLVLDQNINLIHGDAKSAMTIVALHNPPLPEEFEKIDGLSHVVCLDRNRFRITYELDKDIPRRIAEIAATSDWGLFELIPDNDSLEQAFMRLTSSEPTTPGAAEATS